MVGVSKLLSESWAESFFAVVVSDYIGEDVHWLFRRVWASAPQAKKKADRYNVSLAMPHSHYTSGTKR